MNGWAFLALAIALELVATLALKRAATGRGPAIGISVLGYLGSFTSLGVALRTIPVGVAYATWSGVGTALVALAGAAFFGESLGAAKALAIGLIVAGVVLLRSAG